MRYQRASSSSSSGNGRRRTVPHLVCVAAFLCLLVFVAQYSFFAGERNTDLDGEEVRVLSDFQSSVQQCVPIDVTKWDITARFLAKGMSHFEPLEHKYDVCEAILLWEQYRNMTTVLTREYLDARPDGWLEYVAKRIARLGTDKCYN